MSSMECRRPETCCCFAVDEKGISLLRFAGFIELLGIGAADILFIFLLFFIFNGVFFFSIVQKRNHLLGKLIFLRIFVSYKQVVTCLLPRAV